MLELKNISTSFGSLTAVDDLSLDIGPGELFGFIGPNGAGKSTSMKVLACLLKPDEGKARVDGLDCATEGHEIRARLGYMPDFLGVYDDLTVDEYLQFFASAFRIPRKKRRATTDAVLELTDLTEKRRAMVSSLSRGMQQRLCVARVLFLDPIVLLLDEPASGLDPRARIEMRSLLVELREMGKTLMVSSHILTELAEMSTSIGIIERGQLVYAGSIADAYKRVRGADRIHIEFEPDADHPATPAERALTGDARVESIETIGSALRVQLTPGDHGRHFLLSALNNAGLRVSAFTPEPVKLEDAFLTLTKGHVQ